MKYIFYSILTLSFLSACSDNRKDGVILDVRNVVNKTPEEVVGILGKPDTTYSLKILGKQIFCQRYRRYDIEIQYPDSLSTDIVVHGPHGLPFNQTALKAFNLPHNAQHPSQYLKGTLMRWYDFGEFEAISFYNVEMDSAGNAKNFNVFFKAKAINHSDAVGSNGMKSLQ